MFASMHFLNILYIVADESTGRVRDAHSMLFCAQRVAQSREVKPRAVMKRRVGDGAIDGLATRLPPALVGHAKISIIVRAVFERKLLAAGRHAEMQKDGAMHWQRALYVRCGRG